jgi:hypothetical protein
MSGVSYDTDAVDESEDVLGLFYGGVGQVGQQLVVTNRRLLLGPIDTGVAEAIDAYVLDKMVPGGGDLLKSVLTHYAPLNPQILWLRHVIDVRTTNDASMFKAPGIQIKTDTDQVLNIGIVRTVRTRSGDKANNAVRDQAAQVIAAAVRSARTAAPGPV